MKEKISKNWPINKIIETYPEAVDILVDYGFHCIGCAMAQYETLEDGARAHGIDKKKLGNLLLDLNKAVLKNDRE